LAAEVKNRLEMFFFFKGVFKTMSAKRYQSKSITGCCRREEEKKCFSFKVQFLFLCGDGGGKSRFFSFEFAVLRLGRYTGDNVMSNISGTHLHLRLIELSINFDFTEDEGKVLPFGTCNLDQYVGLN
jgi:hypothetical protein